MRRGSLGEGERERKRERERKGGREGGREGEGERRERERERDREREIEREIKTDRETDRQRERETERERERVWGAVHFDCRASIAGCAQYTWYPTDTKKEKIWKVSALVRVLGNVTVQRMFESVWAVRRTRSIPQISFDTDTRSLLTLILGLF